MATREGAEKARIFPEIVNAMGGIFSYFPIVVLTFAASVWLFRLSKSPPAHQTASEAIPRAGVDHDEDRGSQLPSPVSHDANGRVFSAGLTPKVLRELVSGRTTHEAQKLYEPYFGKWLRGSGEIVDVSNEDSYWTLTIKGFEKRYNNPDLDTTTLFFKNSRRQTLETLRPGQQVNFIGRLEKSSMGGWRLDSCELQP